MTIATLEQRVEEPQVEQRIDMRIRMVLQITDAMRVYDQYTAKTAEPLDFKPFLVAIYTKPNIEGDSYARRFGLYFDGQRHHANYGDVKL